MQYRLKKKQDKFREKLFRLQGLDVVKPSPGDFAPPPLDSKAVEILDGIVDELGGDLFEIETATVKIQSILRSRKAKQELNQRKETKIKESKLKEDKELSDAAAKIQSIQRSRRAKKELQDRKEAKLKEDKELNNAAAKIQSILYSRKAKKEFQLLKEAKLQEMCTAAIQVLDEDTAARIIQKMYWHWIEEREYQLQLAEARAKDLIEQKSLQFKKKQKSQNEYIRGMMQRQQEKAHRDEERQRKQRVSGPVDFKAKPYNRRLVGNNAENDPVEIPAKPQRTNIAKDIIKLPSPRANPVRDNNFVTRTTERHRQAVAKHEDERFHEKLNELLVIDKKRLKQYESVLDTLENEKSLISRLTSRVDTTISNSWNVVGALGALANASYQLETGDYDDAFHPNIDENNVVTRLGSALERIKRILAPVDTSPSKQGDTSPSKQGDTSPSKQGDTSPSKPAHPLAHPAAGDVKRTLQYERLDLSRDEYGPVATPHDIDLQNRLKSYKLSEGEKTEDLKLFNSLDNVCRQAMAEINLYDDVIDSMLSNRIKRPVSPPHAAPVAQSSVAPTSEVTEQVTKFLNYPKYEQVPSKVISSTVIPSSRNVLSDDLKHLNPKSLRDSQINFNNERERDHIEKLRSRQSALENYELQKAQRKQERMNELHDLKLEYVKRIQGDLNRSNNSSRNSSSSAGGGGITRPMLKPSSLRPYKADDSAPM